ncbi:histidine kinase hhk13p [Apiospora marii]|uniref:histidine kinase hhk13p n=1 Tax=Apiospora marii TaxID=335849 RepID=UPI00312CFCC2
MISLVSREDEDRRPVEAGGGLSTPVCLAARPNFNWLANARANHLTEFQQFILNVDWAKTSVGPIEQWPQELRQLLRMVMVDSAPCIIYWGDKFTIFYNEAYIPLIGNKHPTIMGQDAADVFPNFWSFFDKIITNQRLTAEPASGDASMLLMERHGFLEETYFDWKLVPLIGENGEVMASYGTPHDLTMHVINKRRSDCVQQLTHKISRITNLKDLWATTLAGLSQDERDLPFALLYSVDQKPSMLAPPSKPSLTCHLEGTIGVDQDHELAREYLNIHHDLDGFGPVVVEALEKGEMVVLQSDHPSLSKLLKGVGWKGFGLPSGQFVIVPIKLECEIVSFLIVGLNPYRRYNQAYTDFLRYIGEAIASQIAKIRLADEVSTRAELIKKAKMDFERSEWRFTKFAERSLVGLAIAQPDRDLLYANDAWYRFAGVPPGTTQYPKWLENVMAEDQPLVEEWWTRVVSEKKGGQFQFRVKQPFRQGHMHSEHMTIMSAVYADMDEFGEVGSVMGLTIDISEQKWVEQQLLIRSRELEESERKWRNYAEHCPLGIVRTDKDGYVEYGNDAWHNYYGFTRGQVHGPQPWMPYVDEAHVEPWKECFRKIQTEARPVSMELKLRDKVFRMEDGDEIIESSVWVLVTGFTEFKEDGSVDYIDFWVTDISGQKLAEKILTDKMDEAIRLKTHQERFIDMISHEIRNPLSAVLHCGEEVVEAMQKCVDDIQSVPGAIASAAGHTLALDSLRSHLDSAIDSANTIMYCVQHQKQIVDDVLTLSKLDADLLVVSPIPVQPATLIRTSVKIFEPELKMTGISLNFSEDASLKALGVDYVLLDPNRFLQIVINLVTNAIKFTKNAAIRNIDITVSALAAPPTEQELGVAYVPRRYEQAKPITPTHENYPEFDVWDEVVYLCFRVKDTGKGLTEEEMEGLYKRFAQASPKTHIEYGGTGLGLFISRQITEMLGGQIGIHSDAGDGCTFAFYVRTPKGSAPRRASVSVEPIIQMTRTLGLTTAASPLVVAPDQDGGAPIDLKLVPPGPPPTLPPTTTPTTTTKKEERMVLVVEDNLINQRVLCKLLRKRGFVVEAANHGQEALELLGHPTPSPSPSLEKEEDILAATRELRDVSLYTRFEVILCDIEMPVMNGIEFTRSVRQLEGRGEMPGHKPVIGVTANVRGEQITAAIESGMDGVTTKPYRIDELIAHIDRVCEAQRAKDRRKKG